MKVLLVEDGDIGRFGRSAALEQGGHRVEATRWNDLEEWAGGQAPDLLVAVLRPDEGRWDQYHRIASLARLTAVLGPDVAVAAVVEPAAFTNPLLTLRLQRAGAQRVASETALRNVGDMLALVDGGAAVPAQPTEIDLKLAGVQRGCDPDAVIAWVEERFRGPLADAYRRAFDPCVTQAQSGLSRRQAHTLRVRLSALGRIRPNPGYSGGGPVRDCTLPRWNEVVAVVNLCRGFSPEAGEGRGEGWGRSSSGWAA